MRLFVSGCGGIIAGVKLDSSSAKLGRADEHFETLKSEIDAWSPEMELLDKGNIRDGSSETFFCDWTVAKIKQPPERWGLIAGDAIQNTRSALDHALYALVIRANTVKYARAHRKEGMNFPVVDDPGGFEEKKLRTWNLGDKVIEAIRDAQPFNETDADGQMNAHGHWLWYLRELSDHDKHRTLHVVSIMPDELKVETDPHIIGGQLVAHTKGPLKAGTHLATFSGMRPRALLRPFKVTLASRSQPCFDATAETDVCHLLGALQWMIDGARKVLDDLEASTSQPQRRSSKK